MTTQADPATAEIEATFRRAEAAGLRLAIKGRFVAIVIVAVFIAASRSTPIVVAYLSGLAVLGLLGLAHYMIIGSRWDRPWIKYVFIAADIAVISWAVATQPVMPSADLPAAFVFRFNVFPFYFVILAVAAFSFSPGLVLWSGIAGCIGWLSAFFYIVSGMETTLDWWDIPANASYAEYAAVILSPDFVARGSRVQESLVFLLVAVLLAVVMRRARRTVRAHIEADRERHSISELFGQYVPNAVANALVRNRGLLQPTEREATVLFADIAGFTALTESVGPTRTVNVLNAYFDAMTEVIGRYNGVVTQFQGDAILATFNVPLADPAHATNAVHAALEMLQITDTQSFDGARLQIRVGVNTGPLVAGSVGGGGRRNYTVHGDCVNTAARLEALNKEFDTRLLVAESIAVAASGPFEFRKVADTTIRGLMGSVPVYTTQTVTPRPENSVEDGQTSPVAG